MPDLDQIKQREQGSRDPRGRFSKGRSGNPAGRPRGCRDHVNRAARLLLAGEGEALTRKAVELALAGDPAAQVAVTLRGAMQLGHVIEAYVRGRSNRVRAALARRRRRCDGFRDEAGQELAIGWIEAVRPLRRPLSRPPQDKQFS